MVEDVERGVVKTNLTFITFTTFITISTQSTNFKAMLQPLELPPYPFKITEQNGRLTLFDDICKKHIVITPEEWVRQHVVRYLLEEKKYPKSYINVEKIIKINGLTRRYDVVVFQPDGSIFLLVECKAPAILHGDAPDPCRRPRA